VLSAETIRTPLALIASDHLPVVAQVRVRAEKATQPADRRHHAAAAIRPV
jgi:hypothetical protein